MNSLLLDLLHTLNEFKAQSQVAHWNVESENFAQLHDFFGKLYAMVDADIDAVAEKIRVLGDAVDFDPHKENTGVVKTGTESDPKELLQATLTNITLVLSVLNSCMKMSNEHESFGLQNFLGGLIEAYEKQQWMVRSHLRVKKTLRNVLEELNPLLPGNYIDDEGVEHESNVNRFIVVEDCPTIASFLEGNPIASEAVQRVLDLMYLGKVAEAETYLEKHHQQIKDQIMVLVRLQPHIAARNSQLTEKE